MSTSLSIIAGIDEAGRGALAGPVVAAACALPETHLYKKCCSFTSWSPFRGRRREECLIADSKALSPDQREDSYAWIQKSCPYGIGIVSQEVIENEGILSATEQAMQEALRRLSLHVSPQFLLVDGRDRFWFDIPHASVIRGDQSEPCIAAASIIAKVTRDRIMRRWGAILTTYGFESHKGYGTDFHCEQIRKHGACFLHRRNFITRISYIA